MNCKNKLFKQAQHLHFLFTSMKKIIQRLFKLRTDIGLSFYVADFFFRKILRQNSNVKWAIHYTSTINNCENIKRGKNVFPGDSPGNFIAAYNGIEIGDFTNIGPNVGLISTNHDFINNAVYTRNNPIIIGKFCWIGMNATIMPEVNLGDFTIVGAGSVVTKSFTEGYCVIAGNPAVVINNLDKEACVKFAKTKYESS